MFWKIPDLESNGCNMVALAFPTFCTKNERISGKSRNVKPRNLSLLCSLLAAAHNNYSVTLQLQLCCLKHVITLGSGVTQFTQWESRKMYLFFFSKLLFMEEIRSTWGELCAPRPPTLCRTKTLRGNETSSCVSLKEIYAPLDPVWWFVLSEVWLEAWEVWRRNKGVLNKSESTICFYGALDMTF